MSEDRDQSKGERDDRIIEVEDLLSFASIDEGVVDSDLVEKGQG